MFLLSRFLININVTPIGNTMFEIKNKFLSIFQETEDRLLNNGFRTGDYVKIDFDKLRQVAKAEKWADNLKEVIEHLSKSQYNLKIMQIDTDAPQSHGLVTGTDVAGRPRFMLVAEEIAANLWGTALVVPHYVLTIVPLEGNNITPGHPKYKENKPEREENVVTVTVPTDSKADDGKRNLPKVNVVIPAGPVRDGKNDAKKPAKK